MFMIIDTFNARSISRHRTAVAAIRAERRYQRAVQRANGGSHYIPTAIVGVTSRRGADSWYDSRRPLTDSESHKLLAVEWRA